MPSPREVPRQFEGEVDEDEVEPTPLYALVAHSCVRPDNEYEALMRLAPHEQPETTVADLLPLRDILVDAIDELDEEERWIFDAYFVRRLSLRKLGAEIGKPKSTVAAWRDRTLAKLREKLQSHPLIEEYLRSE